MPKLNISKNIYINAPKSQVFSTLTDFNTWPQWSPWLIAEPEAKINIAGNDVAGNIANSALS